MSNLSSALREFFAVEIRNEEAMRREAGYPGSEEHQATYEPASDQYVPQSTLGSALDSWEQAPQDVRADWCVEFIGSEEVLDAEDDLRALIEVHGADYPLVDLLG